MPNEDNENNENWEERDDSKISIFLLRLKYNYTINNFYYFRLKKKEGFYSWWIIILTTLISSLNALNNLENEPFTHFFSIVEI